jgi:hypothetical protein
MWVKGAVKSNQGGVHRYCSAKDTLYHNLQIAIPMPPYPNSIGPVPIGYIPARHFDPPPV